MSVCRQLKIDPTPVLASMPDADPGRSVRVTAAISEPLGGVVNRSAGQQKVWWVVGLLILVLLLWIGVSMQGGSDGRPSTSVETPELPPAVMPPPDANSESAEPSTEAPATVVAPGAAMSGNLSNNPGSLAPAPANVGATKP